MLALILSIIKHALEQTLFKFTSMTFSLLKQILLQLLPVLAILILGLFLSLIVTLSVWKVPPGQTCVQMADILISQPLPLRDKGLTLIDNWYCEMGKHRKPQS